MKRAVKFKLKNGKIVTIKTLQVGDYDALMKYFDKFAHDVGAIQTTAYPGRPKMSKELFEKMYSSNERLGIAVWDGDKIIGDAMIGKDRPNHPYYQGKTAGIGITMLSKYAHNGIGSKIMKILENWARENGVYKIHGDIRHLNIASIATCIKNGFIITGIHYNAAFINGKWYHEYIVEKILEK